jgi:hypothetical protein
MLCMRPPLGLVARVDKSFMSNKQVTPRKSFGADVADETGRIRCQVGASDRADTNGFSLV